ncbi:hypothetical protein D3C73_620490 [compost metagenome]
MNNEAMRLARYPSEGYLEVGEVLEPGGNPREYIDEPERCEAEKPLGAVFKSDDKRPLTWKQTGDIWMYGFWYWDWADCTLKVKHIDTSEGTIATEQASYYSIRSEQRYYYFNVLEELDTPGEWYVDREAGILYVYPSHPGEEATAELSLFKGALIQTDGASHIRFRRLQVELTRTEAIQINGGYDVIVEGCRIGQTGGFGISIGNTPKDSAHGDPFGGELNAGKQHKVSSCDIYDTGTGGIYLAGGQRTTLEPAGNIAINNDISNYSRLRPTNCAAIELVGVGNKALRNYIHDAPHFGIYLHGNDHLVEGNEITRVILETGDAGAIYIGRNWTEQGNIIRYNRISRIGNEVTKLQIGIYLDDMASGVTVYGNIIHGTQRAMLVGGGRGNQIENNLIACSNEGLILDNRAMPGEWAAGHVEEGQVMHRRLLEMPYQNPLWQSRYPQLIHIWEDEAGTPKYNKVINNLSYHNEVITIKDVRYEDSLYVTAKAIEYGEKRGNLTVDSGIDFLVKGDPVSGVDPQGNIREHMPEFQPIPVEQIGLYKDEFRLKV